jgi:hypothetical protein
MVHPLSRQGTGSLGGRGWSCSSACCWLDVNTVEQPFVTLGAKFGIMPGFLMSVHHPVQSTILTQPKMLGSDPLSLSLWQVESLHSIAAILTGAGSIGSIWGVLHFHMIADRCCTGMTTQITQQHIPQQQIPQQSD